MLKKALSVIVAVAFVLCAAFMTVSAADAMAEYNYTEIKSGYEGYKPIPLLVLVINFDADGDGKDAYEEGKNTTVKTSDAFKEQWAHSEESYWANSLFGDEGNTMKNYFKKMSKDNFWWEPVEETYGEENNGVVYVTLEMQHPGAISGQPASIGAARIPALQAAAEYVDFAKYDTDGNGGLSWEELTVVYICGGRSTKIDYSPTGYNIWGVHSFQSPGTDWYASINGVRVMARQDEAKYCAVGEMSYDGKPIGFGTIAHELGHVLGANDLYTRGTNAVWCGGPGDIALQGGGSALGKLKGVRDGEAPAAIDPYYLLQYGFEKAEVAQDGTYTLYSRESDKGEYNIIKISTANPKEYYLIENRYTKDASSYDAIPGAAKGIQIWHVDESIMNSFTVPNCYTNGSPHAPGLTPLYPSGDTGGKNYDTWSSKEGKNLFDSHGFKFVGSDTWYTLLTEEQAAQFNLKIEMLSEVGNEMRIKVTGTVAVPVDFKFSYDTTVNSASISGKITDLNAGTLNMITAVVSKKSDYSSPVETLYAKPEENGSFSFDFSGLDSKSTYYTKITAKGSNGESVRELKLYTKAPPKVRTDDYSVYLYKGMTAANRPYEVTVKCGETLKYSFPMEKSLEKFGGWYYDIDCTSPYNMATTKDDCEPVYLYARWIANDNAVMLKIVNAKAKYEVFAIKTGESFTQPVLEDNNGKAFVGWYTDPQFTTEFVFDEPIYDAGTVTVYARWEGDEPATTTTTVTETTSATSPESTSGTETTTGGKSSGGCGSVIGVGASFAMIGVIGAALVIGKKKEEQ
ncbi:MAG: InlB B-repeat-containing protein [Eubacteriales bacterium]|jgi:M6 family metalloprotease-like protein